MEIGSVVVTQEIKIVPGQLFTTALVAEKTLLYHESLRVPLNWKQALDLGLAMFMDKAYIVAHIGRLLWITQGRRKIIRSFSNAESILIKLLSTKLLTIIQTKKEISKNAIPTKKISQIKKILWRITGMLKTLETLYLTGLSWRIKIECEIGLILVQNPS